MAAPLKYDEVVCPACGHRFPLDVRMVDHMKETWERSEKQRLKREIINDPNTQKRLEREAEKRSLMELRRKDEDIQAANREIANLKREVTRLSKKLPGARAQVLGDIRQQGLADLLRMSFPGDRVTQVARGISGADVIQEVVDHAGRSCGTIIWESKRTSSWQQAWVAKLKQDQRRGNHAVAVIVSEARPDDDRPLVDMDGVWVASFEVAADLGAVLREGLIREANARAKTARRDDLKAMVFDYLTSDRFAQHVRAVVETAARMRAGLDQERSALQRRWAEREAQISGLVGELACIYGELNGLGTDLPPIAALELSSGHQLPRPA